RGGEQRTVQVARCIFQEAIVEIYVAPVQLVACDECIAVHELVGHEAAEQKETLRAGRRLNEPGECSDAYGIGARRCLRVLRNDDVRRFDFEEILDAAGGREGAESEQCEGRAPKQTSPGAAPCGV